MTNSGEYKIGIWGAKDKNSIFLIKLCPTNSNIIWEMKKVDGGSANSFNELVVLGVFHFKSLFKALSEATITEVIQVAQAFQVLSRKKMIFSCACIKGGSERSF